MLLSCSRSEREAGRAVERLERQKRYRLLRFIACIDPHDCGPADNGDEAVTLQIDLSFLGTGTWQADVYGDDPANPTIFNRESKAIMAGDNLTVSMSPRGGAVVRITKSAR